MSKLLPVKPGAYMGRGPNRAMNPNAFARWIIIGSMCFAIALSSIFGFMMWRNTAKITAGQRAVVCILAVDPEMRQASVDRCLEEGGLK